MYINNEFYNEHIKTFKVFLRNSKLGETFIKNRFNLMRSALKSNYDIKLLDDIEKRFLECINLGQYYFPEFDIDVIVRGVLGISSRQYDKSSLVDLSNKKVRRISRVLDNKEPQPDSFGDTTITKLGDVLYIDRDFKERSISCYKINKKDDKGHISEYEIFSNIDIEKMKNEPEYCVAVLYSLLDKKNIEETNCGGYVGEIKSLSDAGMLDDSVKVNSKYSITFASSDASALARLRNIVEKTQRNDNKNVEQGDER